MNNHEKEELELDTFLTVIHSCYGYDFKDYARASLKRRVQNLAIISGYQHISEMLPRILYDSDFLNQFLEGMSITVTDMFRDPWVFKALRERVLPALRIFPKINIWHAGCATGEEVYAMAILLKEEGLFDHTQIYATDFNNHSLKIAEEGIYPLERLQKFTENYLQAGGKSSLSDYYHVKYNSAKFDSALKKNIIFTNHNLVEDRVFGEMNLIVCRNVLIYFNQTLQNKVLMLFKDSLTPTGFLLLGDKETTHFSQVSGYFDVYAAKEKIFKLK